MKFFRYGKFSFADYWGSWISIIILLAYSVCCIVLHLSLIFVFFSLVYAFIWLIKILVTINESFMIVDNDIIISKIGKAQKIPIPSELTLIISYADVCPPLAIRTATGKQTHILKDKFAISILTKMPLDITLETLHKNRIEEYTNSIIQTTFNDYRYIYSFVFNQFLLDSLISNRDCILIVPQSLVEKITVDLNYTNTIVYIDKRC